MSGFGDFEPDDAYDLAPADPTQVARRLHQYRRELRLEDRDWDRLAQQHRAARITAVARLLDWGRRQGVFR